MTLKETYILEDKVVFDAHGNVIAKDIEHQHPEQESSKKHQEAKTEPESEAIQVEKSKPTTRTNEEETRRSKREITKPHYLKDFME